MNTSKNANRSWKRDLNVAIATAGAALLLGSAVCYADTPVTMAPPLASASTSVDQDSGADSNAAASVFKWSDVPQNQNVPIDHVTFDAGGYQIYDKSGETIVVPFTNNNLYAMKFALSSDGTTYFVNTGDAPVLYIPQGGYLENATVSGARWYPFPKTYQPAGAVYLGPAPSWNAFIGMGWYAGMQFFGGYSCSTPVIEGGISVALPGLSIVVGGGQSFGWSGFQSYCIGHPGWSCPTVFHQNIYNWAGRPFPGRRPFGSVGRFGFRGDGHFGDHRFGGRPFDPGNHGFGGRTFNAGNHGFGGKPFNPGNHGFGGRPFNPGNHGIGGRPLNAGNHGFGGKPFNLGNHGGPKGGGHSFGGFRNASNGGNHGSHKGGDHHS